MHMIRQAARQAAALAKQAATLAEAAGGAPGSSSVAETLAASSSSFLESLARSQTAGLVSAGRGCHTAAAAARQQQQPVWQQAQQRGLRAWAVQQGTSQHLVAAAASAASHSSAAAAAPWHCQQQRSFSAQAEPAPSSSSNSFSTDGLTLSDAAVERLKELQAQVGGVRCLLVSCCGPISCRCLHPSHCAANKLPLPSAHPHADAAPCCLSAVALHARRARAPSRSGSQWRGAAAAASSTSLQWRSRGRHWGIQTGGWAGGVGEQMGGPTGGLTGGCSLLICTPTHLHACLPACLLKPNATGGAVSIPLIAAVWCGPWVSPLCCPRCVTAPPPLLLLQGV